jgi:hypothetical protein
MAVVWHPPHSLPNDLSHPQTQTDPLTNMNKAAWQPPVENQTPLMADLMADPMKMTELMETSRIGMRGMTINPADLTENLTTCPGSPTPTWPNPHGMLGPTTRHSPECSTTEGKCSGRIRQPQSQEAKEFFGILQQHIPCGPRHFSPS